MDREKQIEEMAEMLEIIAIAREAYANDVTDHTENEYIREGLLNKGYRKQSEGEWIENEHDFYYTCSACDFDWTIIEGTPSENNMNFCPNCGAKMKGGAE